MTSPATDQRGRRLRNELVAFKSECTNMQPNLYMLKSTTDDLSTWDIQLRPGEHSIYHNKTLEVQLFFPESYPVTPLTVTFLSAVYHPNIDESGRVYGDLLSTLQWCPALTARTIILSLLALLDNPDVDGEVVNEAALSMYMVHPDDYKAIATSVLDG